MTFQTPAVAARTRHTPWLLMAAALLTALELPAPAQIPHPATQSLALARAQLVGPLDSAVPVRLALALAPRNVSERDDLIRRLYDPQDPLYGHFLTPEEVTARFGPTAADYLAVADYARSHGLTVVGTHTNRLLLDVSGPAGAVEAAFGVRLQQYQAADGRAFRVPNAAPSVPPAIAACLSGVIGLDTSVVRRPHLRRLALPIPNPGTGPGTGPGGGLSPSDVKTAYGLNGVTMDGRGETMAVFELDGYAQSDIRAYEDAFGMPHVPLENVLVDSVNGSAGAGAVEVTLDIELLTALAPRADKVIVYEGPNDDAGILDTYNEIALENRAKEVSTSWGSSEPENTSSFLTSEYAIFSTMALQGQSVFAAAGDAGAYDNPKTPNALAVDDPGSQPYVTAVGGTTLTTNGPGQTYVSETTWNTGSNDAGGGGISSKWSIPGYQSQPGVISNASRGSTTMRNVPDVSLNADPQTGYAIYFGGGWTVYGGASTATPLWASFTALVNQQRRAAGQGYLGFANPAIYKAALGSNSPRDFHDIADGSSNGRTDGDIRGVMDPNGTFNPLTTGYPAVPGYDLATGWGTFRGAGLLADLTGISPPPTFTAPFTYHAGYNLLSLPDTYSGVPLDTLFGGPTPYYVWDPTHNLYSTLVSPPAQPGQGYWALFAHDVQVTNPGAPVTATAPATVPLVAGWNQIGDPFPSQVSIGNLQVLTGTEIFSFIAASGGDLLVSPVLYRYDNTAGQYAPLDATSALIPGTGYWLYASQPLTLQVPPP